MLYTLGPLPLLAAPRTALFCSARVPGDVILRAHDAARGLRDEGVTVISGFHSALERECLRILLRGTQPIIICLACAMTRVPVLGECRAAFEAGRILYISPFETSPRRVTGSRLRAATKSSPRWPPRRSSLTSRLVARRSVWLGC